MYSKLLLLLLLVLLTAEYSLGQQSEHFFRNDYKYFEATRSFYKIHTVYRTWFEAKRICANENALLLVAEDKDEANTVMSYMNETHPYYWVYVGISDLVAEGVFETVDGRSISDVFNDWQKFEPNNHEDAEDCVLMDKTCKLHDAICSKSLPFICKKTLDSLRWNQECELSYMDYAYNETLGRCYKFHTNPLNWTDAHAVCAAEQSYLAVANSQNEMDYFVRLTDLKSRNKSGNYVRGQVFLGFHNQFDEDWITVKGTTLENSGYVNWAPGQPDKEDTDKCGSMFYNGLLNDIACDKKSFFICEHEIKRLMGSLDVRFGEYIS